MASYLRPRRGRGSTMQSKNPILKKGEVFFEMPEGGCGKGIGKIKVGDGTTPYTSLPYFLEQNVYYFDETSNGVTVTFDSVDTSKLTFDQVYSTYYPKIGSGQKLATIVGAIKAILSKMQSQISTITKSTTNVESVVFVGNSAPAANTPYLLWVDTSSENNFLKFRASVTSSAWTQVSSVWN